MIKAHGGRLEAQSAGRGRGSTFSVALTTVPAPATSEPGPLALDQVPGPAPRLKVLLVEDDAPTLRVLARLLNRPSYTVRTASNLAAALEMARGEDFDLIISDIGLPDGSGLELMRRLRAQRPVRGIALSGYGTEADLRRSAEAGFLAHLTKPVDFRRLEEAIWQATATVAAS
ncbi:MAG: response regulator [Isosphaeraceae bacterium]|nr:response regulator [Isosphaeraceae bacterium]